MNSKNIKIAIDRINQAKRSRLRHLDLSGLNLNELPVDISEMNYLFDLDLSYNQLDFFPKSISELDNLQYLNISSNNIKDIGFKLGKSYVLREVDISSNQLNFIPEEIFFINGDARIIFNDNPFLKDLPPELEFQDNLLYISYYLEALKKTGNRKRLFETKLLLVGKGNVGKTTLMKTLKNPNYDFMIGEEEPTHGINIEQMVYPVLFPAKKPYYSQEDFENIYFIDYELDGGIEINDDGEPIAEYSYVETKTHISEYIDTGNYYDELIEARISDDPFFTHGNACFEKNVKINLWDFGGQELLYGTHQFFLTQRSIYIFIWDSRPDNEVESFDYWLNVIQRLSNNSPVIIVMNKLDYGIKSIDEVSYKEKFKNIVGFYNISCFTKEGITNLTKAIIHTVIDLPHISDELPRSWDDIRERLKETNEDFITYNKFKEICNQTNQENVRFLSSYLNDLGDIVHFIDDFELKDLVIINPHWLTKAIYELIHSLEVQKNYGLFNANDLSNILDETKYPSENYHKILLLMEKFEICFKVIGSNNLFIIPTLLQATPPFSEIKSEFVVPESLKYEIHYDFMPTGLVERLICRLKDYLRGNDFWKYGAVFKTELNEALVILNKPKRIIKLYVIGNVKSTLYSAITQEIKKIHKDLKLKNEDYIEKLACNCIQCGVDEIPYMIDVNVILNFIEKGRTHINCLKSTESVNVEEILIGYRNSFSQQSLLRGFVKATSQLQTHKKLVEGKDENEINTLFQILLRQHLGKDYFPNEQSLKGTSESEIKQGELDIAIETNDGTSVSFYEGMVLNSVNSNKIDNHIIKSLKQYDPNGLKEKFIGVYSRGQNFGSFSMRYLNHIKEESPKINGVYFNEVEDLSKIYVNGSEIKIFRVTYERSNVQLSVYHLLVNMYLN